MTDYVAAPITIDPNVLVQQAFASIQSQIPGWSPMEGQLDVAIIEEAAQMFATTAAVASQFPVDAFKYFGKLVGINPITGTQATAPATFTMTDNLGYTIPAGTQVAYPLSGNTQILFSTQAPVVIPPGNTLGTCVLVCESVGTFANGLPAETCQMVTTFAQVSSIATTATSAGGVAADTETSYINRLSNELQLLAPRPIIPSDFAAMAQNVTGVFRALAIDGLAPGRTITDGVTHSNSTLDSATANFTMSDIGRTVSGGSFPVGTVIQGWTSSSEVTTSNPASASATGVNLTFGDLANQQRCITVCGVDSTGAALSSGVNTALITYLESLREVNFLVFTVTPTITQIDVTVACDALTGVNRSALQSANVASLSSFLSPATWGGGANETPIWDPTSNVVRFIDVANAIRTVSGVAYIPSGSLTIGIHGGSMGSADVWLPGNAPLPSVGTLSVSVS